MGEFRFGQDLVRALLRDQHPDLADLVLRDTGLRVRPSDCCASEERSCCIFREASQIG
jgi:hypothetical protein